MSTTTRARGWDLDLAIGEAAENRLRELLHYHRVEVKSQTDTEHMVFVELLGADRGWSGLCLTEAEEWAFETHPGRWLIIPTADLIDLVGISLEQWGLRVGGDGHRSQKRGAIVPVLWIACGLEGKG